MKNLKRISTLFLLLISIFCFSACGSETKSWTNPGDVLGGGSTLEETISKTNTSSLVSSIESISSSSSSSLSSICTEIPNDAIYYIGYENESTVEKIIEEYQLDIDKVRTYDTSSDASSNNTLIQIMSGGNYVFYGTFNIESSFLYIGPLNDSVVLYFCGIDINVNNLNNAIIVAETGFTLVLLDDTDGKSNTISTASEDETNAEKEASSTQTDDYCLVGLGNYENIDVTICGSGSIDVNLNGVQGIIVDGTVSIFDTEVSITLDSSAIEASEVIILNSSVSINSKGYGIVAIANIDDLQNDYGYEFSYNTGYVIFDNSTISINSQGTGVYSESFVYISSGNTEIIASSGEYGSSCGIMVSQILIGDNTYLDGDYTILIDDGNITINSQMNAIDACGNVLIFGGDIEIEAAGYGIYTKGLFQMNGIQTNIEIQNSTNGIYSAKIEVLEGDLNISATNSGIISDTTILIEGGKVILYGSASESYATIDSGSGFVINGGTIVACGPLGMVETPYTNSSSNIISFASENAIATGTKISVLDSEGNVIAEITLEYDCSSIIFSNEELLIGKTYKVSNESKTLISFILEEGLTLVSLPA